MWKIILLIVVLVADVLAILFMLYKMPIEKGIYVIYGWDENGKNEIKYSLTMYNLSKEKTETFSLKNKEKYEQSFKYQYARIYKYGILGKYFMSFIPFEDTLCD